MNEQSVIEVLEKYQVAHPDLPLLAVEIIQAGGREDGAPADVTAWLVAELVSALEERACLRAGLGPVQAERAALQVAVRDALQRYGQARAWARLWKRAAKRLRAVQRVLCRRVTHAEAEWDVYVQARKDAEAQRDAARAWAAAWKRAAKGWREAALDSLGAFDPPRARVPLVGTLSAETTPEDWTRFREAIGAEVE